MRLDLVVTSDAMTLHSVATLIDLVTFTFDLLTWVLHVTRATFLSM